MARHATDATSLLVRYAAQHRDPRNIATHLAGIPLIVFALGALLSQPALWALSTPWGAAGLTPAVLVWLATTLWYLSRGLPGLGVAVSAANGALLCAAALLLSNEGSSAWLSWGLAALALGWCCQWVGHYYEGPKPATTLNLSGLLTGPMFVVAEALFAMGCLRRLKADIERQAGPTQVRNLAMPAG